MAQSSKWQVAEARHRFGDLLEAAVEGRPQHIRHRNGREFILVTKEYFDSMKLDLHTVLTSFDFGTEDDEFDRALAELHSINNSSIQSTSKFKSKGIQDVSGHKRRKRNQAARSEP